MDDNDFFINISGVGSSFSAPKSSNLGNKSDKATQRASNARPHAKSDRSFSKQKSKLPLQAGKRKHSDDVTKSSSHERPAKKHKTSKHAPKPAVSHSDLSKHESRSGLVEDSHLSEARGIDASTMKKRRGKIKKNRVPVAKISSPEQAPEVNQLSEARGIDATTTKKRRGKIKKNSVPIAKIGNLAQAPEVTQQRRHVAERTINVVRSEASSGGFQTGVDLANLGLHESLKRQLDFLKFKQCTPVQALAIPAALDKRGQHDILIRASTGSGKTLAFLLPVLNQLLHLPPAQRERKCGTLALILSPTKELALQTLKVSQDLLRMVPSIVCGSVAGGEKPKSEKERLRKGLGVLCATPGRLAYHLEHTASFAIGNLRYLVMDEADRLLDLGFEPQIRRIYKTVKEARENFLMAQEAIGREVPTFLLQSLLVSATLTPAVRRLASFCLRKDAFWADPDTVENGQQTEVSDNTITFSVPKTLTQWYCLVPCKERLVALISSIISRTSASKDMQKAIVFFATNSSVDFHHDIFKDIDWPSISGFTKAQPSNVQQFRKRKDGFIGFADAQEDEEDDEEDDDEDEEEEEENVNDREGSGKDGTKAVKRTKIFANRPLFKLHGDLDKEERSGYIRDFSKAAGGVLLSSDAASRGLDFPQIDWIIQFDPPQSIEEYLHRIGRTARIGRKGNALLFLQPHERGFLDVLRSHGVSNLKELDPKTLPLELLRCGAPSELSDARDFGQLLAGHLSSHVAACVPLIKLARSAFLSALRSYKAFPRELRSAFPYHELHTGHFASSFALRETPEEASRHQRKSWGGKNDSGKGKGKSKGAGKGKEAPHMSSMQPRKRRNSTASVMNEFS